MNELLDLLKRWSALEPDRCKLDEHADDQNCYALNIKNSRDGEKNLAFVYLELDIDNRDWAIIQQAVQRAIVSRSLLFRLENDTNGRYYALIVHPTTQSHSPGKDAEPAIALLRAYLTWLEKSSQVTTGGGEGT